MRLYRQATLIQDASQFIGWISPALRERMAFIIDLGYDRESVLLWIMQECIRRREYYHDVRYAYDLNKVMVFDDLNYSYFDGMLEKIFSYHLELPRLYGDNTTIATELRGKDLWIHYVG